MDRHKRMFSVLAFACGVALSAGCLVDDEVLESPDDPAGEPTASLGRCVIAGSIDSCTGAPGEVREYRGLIDGDLMMLVIDGDGARFGFGARTSGMDPGDMADPASVDNPDVGIVLATVGGDELARYRGKHPFAIDDASRALTVPDIFVPVDPASFHHGDVVVARLAIRDRDGIDRWGEAFFIVTR